MDKLKNSFQYFHSLNSSTPEYFERRYIRHIQNLNKRYAKLFDKFFWYVHKISSVRERRLLDVGGGVNNIGQKYGAFNFMVEKFGNDPVKFFNEIVLGEDDVHLSAYGNKLLYENYILKSKIGDYLNDKPV